MKNNPFIDAMSMLKEKKLGKNENYGSKNQKEN